MTSFVDLVLRFDGLSDDLRVVSVARRVIEISDCNDGWPAGATVVLPGEEVESLLTVYYMYAYRMAVWPVSSLFVTKKGPTAYPGKWNVSRCPTPTVHVTGVARSSSRNRRLRHPAPDP